MNTQPSGTFPAVITLLLATGFMLAAAEPDPPPSKKPGWEWTTPPEPPPSKKPGLEWTTPHDRTIAVLRGHERPVWSVAFSPDGSRIVSGSADNTVRLWDTASGDELAVGRGHTDEVFSVAFSPDGSVLASASMDSTVRLWDVSIE